MLSPTELITHNMVPEAGIEPTTFGLEGHCSSTELLGHKSNFSSDFTKKILISKSWQLPTLPLLVDEVPSAQVDWTAVFGMGTGVPQLL